MSQGLAALRDLLFASNARVTGVVTRVEADVLHVATSTGVRVVAKTVAAQFQTGDEVAVEGSQLIGKVLKESTLPVYYV